MSNGARALSLCFFLTALAGFLPGSHAAIESPTAVVRDTINEVIRILEDPGLKQPSQAKHRRRLLEDVIAQRFDYEEMSKRTLAAHWRQRSTGEQQEFVELFRAFLSNRYADKIEGYAGEQVQYLSERLADGYAEVRTRLVSSKLDVPMDYRLFEESGKWYAYDIIVNGVSLVSNYRSQFREIIADSSYETLVDKLRKQVNRLNPAQEGKEILRRIDDR